MICPGPGGPREAAPGFAAAVSLRAAGCGWRRAAPDRRPTITGIEKMRDDVALFASGFDGGRHHEHAFLGGQQHELMRERFFGCDVVYWPEALARWAW